MHTSLLLWIVLLPLLGSLWNGITLLLGYKSSTLYSGIIATIASLASFLCSVQAFWLLRNQADPLASLHRSLWTWIAAGNFRVDLTLILDPLSALLLLLTTGMAFLAHVYSLGFMHGHPYHSRYFCYLNLLVFSMVVLILADNLVMLFLGWQGVGLISSLFIGFEYQNTETAKAGVTTWIISRVGDLFFLLGIFVLFWAIYPHMQAGESLTFSTIGKYIDVLKEVQWWRISSIELTGFFLLVGALAKSAQVPLHIWSTDAEVGPLPASALLFTITSIAAGIYMLARMNLLYSATSLASTAIVIIGGISAWSAASMALFQHDIRKILIHISLYQVGLIFVGLGIGAYTAALFHLITHASFMVLLFFCAGTIVTSIQGECDIRNMGGLFHNLSMTGFLFLIGTISMIGFPGFSGFFSKDKILWKTFATQHNAVWLLCILASLVATVAMTRLFCLVFLGKPRTAQTVSPLHLTRVRPESRYTMTIPTIMLALFSALGGFLAIPYFLTGKHPLLEHWLAPVFAKGWLLYHPQGAELMNHVRQHPHLLWGEGMGMVLTTLMMFGAVGTALYIYAGSQRAERAIHTEWIWQQPGSGSWKGWLYRLLFHQYYLREIYTTLLVRPILHLSKDGLWPFDQIVVHGMLDWLAQSIKTPGRWFGSTQTENTRWQSVVMFWIVFALLLWLLITYVLP